MDTLQSLSFLLISWELCSSFFDVFHMSLLDARELNTMSSNSTRSMPSA